jgi:hypothetical protein
MNNRKIKDIKFGEECEQLFLSKFKNVIKNSDNINDEIDFKHKNKKIIYELKSRKYNFGDCPDWKVGYNKLVYGYKNYVLKGYDFYIYMLFYDGLRYWKFNKNEIDKKMCGYCERVDRGRIEKKYYFNIKRELFKKSKIYMKAPKPSDPFEKCLL